MIDELFPPSAEQLSSLVQALLQILLGIALGWLTGKLIRRAATERFSPAQAEVAGRLLFWVFTVMGIGAAMSELGFDLSILMGAAGLLTVAVGFASQTSASNLISGLFLLFERPFSIRDTLQVGGTTGEVVSIDLLSVRLRTFDNRLVRVPNETLLKSEIINLSHFPLRRFDLLLRVPYSANLDEVRTLLLEAADRVTAVMDEPRPMLQFLAFGDNGPELQLSVWFVREEFVAERTRFALAMHRVLRDAGIEIPVPQRAVRRLDETP